ncbi:MAG: hypothetical protein GY948_13815 [Alphaproteobacteria bacterium]|nr:hypothetical protein [Alphaproteobacteria bacterium]
MKWSKEASEDAGELGDRVPLEALLEKIGENDDGSWLHLQRTLSAGTVPHTGWFKTSDVHQVDTPENLRLKMDKWAFLKTCVRAELSVNALKDTAPCYINADYLVALALYESKIENIGNKTPKTDATGPFQVTSQRWASMIENGKKAGKENSDFQFNEFQRDVYPRQIFGMALLTQQDTKAISEAITAHDAAAGTNGSAIDTGGYIPTYSDIFIAAVASVKAAIELRKLEINKKGNTVITTLVDALDADRKGEMERIFRHNHHVFKVDKAEAEREGLKAGPRTVSDLYRKVEEKLDQLLADAFKLMNEMIPEDIPVKPKPGGNWLQTAETELKTPWKNGALKENEAAGTKRVLDYFKATDLSTNKVLPWCGAFTAFCMKENGVPVVKGAARAANWKSWGNQNIPLASKDIPAGAVVVLSPPAGNSARSGHVALYSGQQSGKPGTITLLGGNQSNTVKNSDFKRSKVVAIRWNETGGTGADSATVEGLAPLLNLIGKHESGNNYTAYYAHAGNKTDPELTTMTVNAVIAFQKKFVKGGSPSSAMGWYQIIRKTLEGLKSSLKLSGNEKFDAAMQDKLGVELLNQRGLQRFLSGSLSETNFAHNVSKEWASFPRATGSKPELSFYAGDGLNKAHASLADVRAALKKIKNNA